MTPQIPPPLPQGRGNKLPLPIKILLMVCVLAGLCMFGFIGLRLFGLIVPYSVPSNGMSPAVVRGDNILMEGITYHKRKPQRGEILVFKTDGVPSLQSGQIYLERLVGLPGDNISITEGAVYINGVRTPFRNHGGEIVYANYPAAKYLVNGSDSVTVPAGYYFVLGDNSLHSSDSRFWGCVPEWAVLGRVAYCYWPPSHVGTVE